MNYWKLFKNLLHNDLHITKDDIQEMICIEVKNQVKALIEGRNGLTLENMAKREIKEHIQYRVDHKVIADIAKQVEDHIKVHFTYE